MDAILTCLFLFGSVIIKNMRYKIEDLDKGFFKTVGTKYFTFHLMFFVGDNFLKVYNQKVQFIHVNGFFCSIFYVHVQFLNFQLNTVKFQSVQSISKFQIQLNRVEFLGDDGKFDTENYVEGHNFTVNGFPIATSNVGEWQMPNTQSTPASVSSTPTSSRVPRRIPLATLKVVRADLGSNGKPKNMNYHNLTAHINLYVEEKACITNIQLKVWKEMADNKLAIVGANGLVIPDQETTRGNPKYLN